MKILETLKDFFSKGPQEPEAKEVEPAQETESQDHHHNHGSSTT